jgi:hypothetical protein
MSVNSPTPREAEGPPCPTIINSNYLPINKAPPNHASIIAGAGATEAQIRVVEKDIIKL